MFYKSQKISEHFAQSLICPFLLVLDTSLMRLRMRGETIADIANTPSGEL